MIIFDLDGTLADCEHRRHFVKKKSNCTHCSLCYGTIDMNCPCKFPKNPDWKSFYEACDQDKPIEPVISIFESLIFENHIRLGKKIEIWSGRCESVREKTEKWLEFHVWGAPSCKLKMRAIADSTPDDHLKEKWLDEALSEGKTIDFVIDADQKSIEMWKRRGIFVFDVSQGKSDF